MADADDRRGADLMTNFATTLTGSQGQSPWFTNWSALMTMLDATFAALVATGYTSQTGFGVGTGVKTFAVNQSTANVQLGQVLTVFSVGAPGNIMVGDVTAVPAAGNPRLSI